MRRSTFLMALLATSLIGVRPTISTAQDLQDVRSHLPVFTSDSTGTSAVLYSYFPSLDLTVKTEARSRPDLFTPSEVAYILGGLYASLPGMLAQWWYPNASAAQLSSVASKLQHEGKDLKTPFEDPRASLLVDLGADGITITYAGQSPGSDQKVSYSRQMSWKDVLGESGS